MSLRNALLAATILAMPVVAQAQPVTGLYLGAGAGANFRMDAKDGNDRIKTEDFESLGFVGVGSIGYGFGNGLRLEIEGNWRQNEGRRSAFGGGVVGDGGLITQYGGMVNALYDFQIGSRFVPYVGVGVGYGFTEVKASARNAAGNITTTIDDEDGQLAYQGILGASYVVGSAAPGLALTAEYRFYGTLEPELSGRTVTRAVNNTTTSSNFQFKPENFNHAVLLGLRYNFGVTRTGPAPTPAAPTAQAPQIARTYLVFFDWDRADLTERARQIIGEAAGNARRVQTTRIEVAGHADRSGTPAYNQRLSQRRADVVAAELVRLGINRNEIAIQAFGESRPLVPTADGVREPQNRRVEIVLR